MLKNKIDDILYTIEKPSRYIGDEINSVKKDLKKDLIEFLEFQQEVNNAKIKTKAWI